MLSKMQGCENTQKKRTATLCVLLIFKMLILLSKGPGSIFLLKKKKKKVCYNSHYVTLLSPTTARNSYTHLLLTKYLHCLIISCA